MKVQLVKLAHARSGDKGDTANVGVIALKDDIYPILVREVTAENVKAHFGPMVKGDVERFELPNLKALNFLLHEFVLNCSRAHAQTSLHSCWSD